MIIGEEVNNYTETRAPLPNDLEAILVDAATRASHKLRRVYKLCRCIGFTIRSAHARKRIAVVLTRKQDTPEAWQLSIRSWRGKRHEPCLCRFVTRHHGQENLPHLRFFAISLGFGDISNDYCMAQDNLRILAHLLNRACAEFVVSWGARWIYAPALPGVPQPVSDETLECRPSGVSSDPQRLPDSAWYPSSDTNRKGCRDKPYSQSTVISVAEAFPTDAKERERDRQKAQHAAGKARVVKACVKHIE